MLQQDFSPLFLSLSQPRKIPPLHETQIECRKQTEPGQEVNQTYQTHTKERRRRQRWTGPSSLHLFPLLFFFISSSSTSFSFSFFSFFAVSCFFSYITFCIFLHTLLPFLSLLWLWLKTTSVMMTMIAIIISICFEFFSHKTLKMRERKSFFRKIRVYITLSFVTLI